MVIHQPMNMLLYLHCNLWHVLLVHFVLEEWPTRRPLTGFLQNPKVRQHPKLVLKVHIVRRERRLQQGLVLAFLAITVRQVQVILHKLLLVTSLIAEEVWFLRYVSPGHGRH